MTRGNKLEGQIRAVLAAEASTRRLVAVHAHPAVGARIMRTVLTLSAAVLLIVGALALGSGVRLLRSSPVASEPQATTQGAAVGVCAAARQRVLGMSSVITRLDRIEVKRMTVQDLDVGRDTQAPGVTRPASLLPGTTALCVVAVGGEIRQTMGLIETGPFRWSLFVSTAGADDPIISTSSGQNGTWPPYFDALPNRQPNAYPGTVVDAVGPDTLRVRLESAMLSAEFGNPVLVQANKYTEIVPTAPTVAATGVKAGDRVEVIFEREGRDISSGAYPLSIFRLTQSATAPANGSIRDQIAQLRPRLTFSPWIPAALTAELQGTARLQTAGTIGLPYLVVEYRGPGSGEVLVQVLEGPAGCCLDSVRAGQPRTVPLNGDVRAQLIPNQPQFGGPILWWDAPNGTYIAIMSTSLDNDTMIAFARGFEPAPRSTVDCGTVRATDGSSSYDQALLDCVWAAYTRGDAARLNLTMVTQEGDPMPTTLLAVPGGRSEMTRDLTADRFSNPANRVVSAYSCTTLTRRPWATDPARYVFELSDCTGPSATASFP